MPSLYILHQLFSSPNQGPDEARPPTQIHLQDYNVSVLQLVTLPNALLTWCRHFIFSSLRLFNLTLTFLKIHHHYPCLTVHQ